MFPHPMAISAAPIQTIPLTEICRQTIRQTQICQPQIPLTEICRQSIRQTQICQPRIPLTQICQPRIPLTEICRQPIRLTEICRQPIRQTQICQQHKIPRIRICQRDLIPLNIKPNPPELVSRRTDLSRPHPGWISQERNMARQDFDFHRLISPMEPGIFFAEYWEKKPLIISRKQSDYYADLLSLADVDHIISSTHLRHPAVRLVKNGSPVNLHKYATDRNWGSELVSGLADVDKLLDEYQGGATILLQSLNRHWRPLSLLCRNLEQFFTHPVHANIYLTPRASQGFAPHYDTQETFILQAAGSKHWRIYDSPVPLPHPGQPYNSKLPTGRPQYEFDLEAGDLIYMPRGYVHEALTSQTISLHITVAVSVYTWVEVFSEALSACREDPRFRKSLPIGFALEGDESGALQKQFKALLKVFPDMVDLDDILDKISGRFVSSRPPILEGHLLELNDLDLLQADTVVRRRMGVLYRLLHLDDSLSLQYHGRKIQLPRNMETALRFILEADDFNAEMLPGNMQASEKLELVRRLVREGFLTAFAGSIGGIDEKR